ncbi:hypothetical protein FJZ36_04190 [Candidatus Poribacteria bacterium]|nr:hypothetical protein [Candidatus Poribacteria bacterium]
MTFRIATFALSCIAIALLPARAGKCAERWVWWEGENPIETNFPDSSWFSSSTFPETRDLLSGGEWLTNAGERTGDEAYAIYDVAVPADGQYDLWTRKFWKHGPFRWRFGTDEWRICGRDVSLADDTYLRTHLGAHWVYLGTIDLREGNARFELRLLAGPGENLTAAFDAFLLTQDAFLPNGKLKPGERSAKADPGYFPFEPGLDPFSDSALLDLRSLNEAAAGEHGFVQRDGARFVLGDGTPVRFWGVNVSANNAGQDRKSVAYLARKLAKLGVNCVRYHGPLFDASGDPAIIDARKLDDLHYLIAAMKSEGIYTFLSFYFPLWFDIRPSYGIDGYETIENKKPFALLFFDERMQAIYRSWLDGIFSTPNPYTGVPLSQEPAVSVVELQNEDSFFFWTFTQKNVPAVHWERLERRFAHWLEGRYGSLANALESWGSATHPDDAAGGRAGIFEAWHMTRDGSRAGGPDKTRRIGDQVRFLTELQREFYEQTIRHLRDDLGSQSLVSPSNWHVTDGPTLDALERYTYGAGEVIDRHGYFGGKHDGEGSGYAVRVEHTFENTAAVQNPTNLPFNVFQTGDYPHTVSEIGWPQPNRFRADMTFLASAYGSLQDIDGFYFFAVGSNFLRDTSMAKFQVGSPVVAGSFPAAALQYRRGDVAAGVPAIRQVLRLDDLFAMQGSGAATPEALDALRAADVPADARVSGPVSTFDPLSFAVGPVVRVFGENPADSTQAAMSHYIDRSAQVVRSLTGELEWRYGVGIATVDTPRSQGAVGFLAKAGPIALGDVTIECRNEFGSVSVISLDGLPLAESRRILVQTLTEDRPYGFRQEGERIASLGGSPFGVAEIRATVKFPRANGRPIQVVALDENGYVRPRGKTAPPDAADGSVLTELNPDAIYHVLIR